VKSIPLNTQPDNSKLKLVELLNTSDLRTAGKALYNSLEVPVLKKYPLLALFQDFLREQGAPAVLMSGSGSTTFAILENEARAREIDERVQKEFGPVWTAVVAAN